MTVRINLKREFVAIIVGGHSAPSFLEMGLEEVHDRGGKVRRQPSRGKNLPVLVM